MFDEIEEQLRQILSDNMKIDKALVRNPNFRLGHLVRGDMLMARAGKPTASRLRIGSRDAILTTMGGQTWRVTRAGWCARGCFTRAIAARRCS